MTGKKGRGLSDLDPIVRATKIAALRTQVRDAIDVADALQLGLVAIRLSEAHDLLMAEGGAAEPAAKSDEFKTAVNQTTHRTTVQ